MEHWIPVVLSAIGSGGIVIYILNGIGKWYSKKQNDKAAETLAYVTEIKELRKTIFEMQQDRIRYEMTRRESADETMKVLNSVLAKADQTSEIMESIQAFLASQNGGRNKSNAGGPQT